MKEPFRSRFHEELKYGSGVVRSNLHEKVNSLDQAINGGMVWEECRYERTWIRLHSEICDGRCEEDLLEKRQKHLYKGGKLKTLKL